ncbi:MAG TPA: prolyl oligopeptidase family serine peptidase [Candidatus Limnocylindrales bacterium]
MGQLTSDTDRYREVVARYRGLIERAVGGVESIGQPEVSPDGALVAVIVGILDGLEGRGHTELHVLAVDGSRRWRVTEAGVDASDPRWTRGGAALTFLTDIGTRHRPAPFLLEVGPDGPDGEPRRLASPPGVPELQRPSPDGSRLLLVVAGEHAEVADGLGSGSVGELAARASGEEDARPAWTPAVETTGGEDEWRTTWLLDVATGVSRQVSPPGMNTWEADWLGRDAAVVVASDSPAEDAWYGARVARLDLASGAATTLYRGEWQLEFTAGSPDGRSVAVIEGVASDRYFTAGELLVVASDVSGALALSTGAVDVLAFRWLDDGRLLAAGIEGMESVLGVAGIDGSWRETWRGAAALGGNVAAVGALGEDGDAVVPLDGPDQPVRLVAIEGGTERLILGTRTAVHDDVAAAAGRARVVEWRGRDGTRVEGLLYLPAGDGPCPAILWVHGGPVSAAGQSYPDARMAVLVEAGYAVLRPNPRGSTGRGRQYAAAVVGDMGGEDSHDLLAGVEWLISEGIADPARIAVAGVSYGGYMAAHLPTLTDRFAAAIVASPLTDMVSAYFGSSLTVFVRDYVGGRPATDPARYLDRSPVFAGERLRTPTLITNGLRDRATPMGQAVELFRALREQGVDAELAIYPTEGHGFSDVATRTDWVGRMVTWLDRYLAAR